MKDNNIFKYDSEIDDLQIKDHLNEALSFKGITVSEDLISRTLAAVQKDGLQRVGSSGKNPDDIVEHEIKHTNDNKDIIDISGLNTAKKISLKKVFQYSSIVAASILLIVGLSSTLGSFNKKSNTAAEPQVNTATGTDMADFADMLVTANKAEDGMNEEESYEMFSKESEHTESESSRIDGAISEEKGASDEKAVSGIASITNTEDILENNEENSEVKYGVAIEADNQFTVSTIIGSLEDGSIDTMGKEDNFFVFVGVERNDIEQVTVYDLQNQRETQLDEDQIDEFYAIMQSTEYRKVDLAEVGATEINGENSQESTEKEKTDASVTKGQENSSNSTADNQGTEEGKDGSAAKDSIMGYQANIIRKSKLDSSVILWIGIELEIIDTMNENPNDAMEKYTILDYQTVLDGLSKFFEKTPQ